MKKSFMTRVLAVSLSAAMAFSMSSASNLMTASAASTVSLKTNFKTLKVKQTYKMTLKNNTLNWKITKVKTSNKQICTVYGKTASSVMLKGKSVGRAKITVKVKTTKRKYPKNIKNMKCTVNVKAADPVVTEEFKATSAAANSITEVRVSFNQAIDAPEASNFTITGESGSISVNKAELSDDKKSVLLTIAGADYGKNYDLTVKGIKVAGKEQAEQKLTFTTPPSEEKYPMTLTAEKTELKSDGQDGTIVTFTINDSATGKPITDKNVEVAFASDYGKFAEQRVSIQNGQAKVMFTSEALQVTRVAKITATVVESRDNHDLMGLNAATSITLSPNPGDTSIGAIITSITAPTADRIIAYFNQPVKAEDFLTKNKKIDTSKFSCTVKSGLDNGWVDVERQTETQGIVGIMDVDTTEGNALALLVEKPMVDNTNVSVEFTNKTATNSLIEAKNTVYTKLTDARQPGALNVTVNGLREIKIEFSEAVLPSKLCDGYNANLPESGFQANYQAGNTAYFAADNINNYTIDGEPLSNWFVNVKPRDPKVETEDSTSSKVKKISSKDYTANNELAKENDGWIQVGSYTDGEDTRYVVTINVGSKRYLTPGRQHSVTISNVGDWAAKTDRERNIVNTETFNVDVQENDLVPSFEVEPQSPEQWLVTFNSPVKPVQNDETIATERSQTIQSLLRLQERIGSTWVDISDADGAGKNPVMISRIVDSNGTLTDQYLVEVQKDWTEVYDTANTRLNYFNKSLRLHMDANSIVNLANNKQNAAIDQVLTGDIMTTPDVKSPEIVSMERATDESGNLMESYNIQMTEPVKLSATANHEGLTPSQDQRKNVTNTNAEATRLGVPAPSAEFISAGNGQTIPGIITDDVFIDAEDKTINIAPETELSAGKWTLAIMSISDDKGNTASTVTYDIDVEREAVVSDFKVVWAAVSETENYNPKKIGQGRGNYIFVKFSKPLAMTGNSTNAGVTANYTVNGNTMPTGTQIVANIKGYDNHDSVTDSITIKLPTGSYTNPNTFDVDGENAILNISKSIASATGATLSGDTVIRMPYNYGEAKSVGLTNEAAAKTYDKIARINSLRANSDAVWGNHEDERFSDSEGKITNVKEYYQKLKAALDNDKYRMVVLTHDLDFEDATVQEVFGRSHTLTINRAVDFDLNGNNINNCNVVVSTTDCVDEMMLMNSKALTDISKITGYNKDNTNTVYTLKVTAGSIKHFTLSNVTVEKRGTNGNAININDVYKESFINNGTVRGNIVITDSNQAGFNAGTGSWIEGSLIINTTGEVNLEGNFDPARYTGFNTIEVNQAAVLRILENGVSRDGNVAPAQLYNVKIDVNSTAKDARIIVRKGTTTTGMVINAFTVVRVTIPSSNVDSITFKNCTKDADFKSVTEANKDLTSSTEAAVDVKADKKVLDSKVKQVLDRVDVLNPVTIDFEGKSVGNREITWGALSTTSINVTDNMREIAKLSSQMKEENDSTEYNLTAKYNVVGSAVSNVTLVGDDTVIVAKDKPTANAKDRVEVILTVYEKNADGSNGKEVTRVTKYIDITNPQ